MIHYYQGYFLPSFLSDPLDGDVVHAMHLFETKDAMHWNAA